jgi:hypothetical protein
LDPIHKVCDAGTHAELLRSSSAYQKLVKRQLQWGNDDADIDATFDKLGVTSGVDTQSDGTGDDTNTKKDS